MRCRERHVAMMNRNVSSLDEPLDQQSQEFLAGNRKTRLPQEKKRRREGGGTREKLEGFMERIGGRSLSPFLGTGAVDGHQMDAAAT